MVSDYHTPTILSGVNRRITGALAAGMLIGARYHVIRLLGRGGFGAVYLATDNRFPARRVAVKEMGDAQLSLKDRVQAIARFRQEANLLSSLQHANLPAVSDFLEEGGKAYMVMDFIEGQTLEEVQRAAGGPLAEGLVMGWSLQVCEVLEYLHKWLQPIIFRDLKPPNTMLTPAGQIKLIDFGIARIFRADALRDTHELGSQGYAAPEQYGLEQTDARTDIYALGAMLYALLTNEEPLPSFTRIVSPGSLIAPRQLNPRLSPGVEQVILTAMQIEKRQRYQSALEMAQAITRLGFSVTRATGGIKGLSAPDDLTVISTQPGSYRNSSTIQSAQTQVSPASALPPTQMPLAHPQIATPPALVPQQGSAPNQPVRSVPQSTASTLPMSIQTGGSTTGGPLAQSGGTQAASGQFSQGIPPVQIPGGPGYIPPGPTYPPGSLPGPPQHSSQRGLSRRTLLIGGGVAALAGATGLYFIFRGGAGQPSVSASGTVTVNFAYSTEKAAWLKPAINVFNASHQKLSGSSKVIQVQPDDLGSFDSVEQILHGSIKPVAWSPASMLEVNRLDYEWLKRPQGTSLIGSTEQFLPRPLVKSPLVLASWQPRAQLLLKHYNVPTLDWDTLSAALQVPNWSQLGGQSTWQQVKFGQTLPTQSNSGLLTITLLAYHYYKDERTLTTEQVTTSAYWDYLATFESAVNAFGHSSGTYLANDIIGNGPAQADVIATYESLVLTLQGQAQLQQQQPLLIYYPPVNLLSDHPFVVLQGSWVTDEQKQAALQFRDFLLTTDQQLQALAKGFRPVDKNIVLQDPKIANNPFSSYTTLFPHGQPDPLLAQAKEPGGDIVDALLTNWSQHYPAPATTDG